MADTNIAGLNNRLSRRNQDIIQAIKSGVSDKRKAITSLRVNFNQNRARLADTKKSLNKMNVEDLNKAFEDTAQKINQATLLLNELVALNDQDEAVGILQRSIKLMTNEFNFISNRLKGSLLDYNNVNRGIVDLAQRVDRRVTPKTPLFAQTSTITGTPITAYKKAPEPRVSINRVGNYVVTRLAAQPNPSTTLNPYQAPRIPQYRISQTVIRNESEHKEWQKSFFKQFEDTRDKNFKDVIKALKGLKFGNLPGPGNNNDIDLPEIPDNKEKKGKPGTGDQGNKGKNNTTDNRSRGLKTGLAVGGARRALEEASANFVDENGNPIEDKYGSNPFQFILKKGKELLESKPVEEGFQGIRTRIRTAIGLASDTPATESTTPLGVATIEGGKIEVLPGSTPIVSDTNLDIEKSEIVLDQRWLDNLLRKLLGMAGGAAGQSGGNSGGSDNSSTPQSSTPNATSANPNEKGTQGTPATLSPNSSKPIEEPKKAPTDSPQVAPVQNNEGSKGGTPQQPDTNKTTPQASVPNPVTPQQETPKADQPSDVTGGNTTQQESGASAKPSLQSGSTQATTPSRIDTPTPLTPSPTPPVANAPSMGDSPTVSPVPSTQSSSVPATAPSASLPSNDPTTKTTGEVAKDPDDKPFEMQLDELEVTADKPPDPPPTKTTKLKAAKTSFDIESPSPVTATPTQYDAEFNKKKEEAWNLYQKDATPRSNEGLVDYMKRRDSMGLDNGGRREDEAQSSNNAMLKPSETLEYKGSGTNFQLTPNTDNSGDYRVPYTPPRIKEPDTELPPIEKSTVDTSAPSSSDESSSFSKDSKTGSTNTVNESPKTIIMSENLGLVQIDGEYLT